MTYLNCQKKIHFNLKIFSRQCSYLWDLPFYCMRFLFYNSLYKSVCPDTLVCLFDRSFQLHCFTLEKLTGFSHVFLTDILSNLSMQRRSLNVVCRLWRCAVLLVSKRSTLLANKGARASERGRCSSHAIFRCCLAALLSLLYTSR